MNHEKHEYYCCTRNAHCTCHAYYVPPKSETYTVLIKSNHNSVRVNGVNKSVADKFLEDWNSGKCMTVMIKGTNVCYGARTSCITEITITKE